MFKRKTTRTLAGISGSALLAVSAWAFAQAVDQTAEPVEPYAIQAPDPADPMNQPAATQALDPQAQDPEPMPGSSPVDTVPPALPPAAQPTAPAEPAPVLIETTSVTVFAAPPSESEKIDRYEAMDRNKDGVISGREFAPGLIDDASLNRIALERQLARTDGQPMSYSAPVSPTR